MARIAYRLRGLLRAGLVLVLFNFSFAWFFAQKAKSRLAEGILGVPFLQVEGAQARGLQVFELNGVPFRSQTSKVPLPWRRVLDEVGEACRARGGLLDQRLERLLSWDSSGNLKELLNGVLRVEDEKSGLIVCVEGEASRNVGEWAREGKEALDRGDLSGFGKLRYVRVVAIDSKASVVLTVWADAELDLRRMFPMKGDAPGRDPDGIPRVPESRRVISVHTSGAGPSLAGYHSALAPERALTFYREWLLARNLRIIQGSAAISTETDGRRIDLSVTRHEAGGSLLMVSLP